MQTITWNKRHLDGSTEEVRFTRLFSMDGGVEEGSIRAAVEVIARRQGVIRTERQFHEELSQTIRAYRSSARYVRNEKEARLAREYFGTQAMLVTVRYGLGDPEVNSLRAALNRFKEFMREVAGKSPRVATAA